MTEVRANRWFGVEALAGAAKRCARRKRGRPDAIAFRMREGEELLALAARLGEGRYEPEPGRVFVTERPKYREVHAAAYRDRVVHHLLHGLLEPALEPGFSSASFACRRGRGTHAAALALQQWMWRLSRHGGRRVYFLQLDVVNFFMSLHRPTLLELLAPVLRSLEPCHPGVRRLCETIVAHDPTRGVLRTSTPGLFVRVPPHKRLGALGPERGLPIGNLTSQFFANVYLTPLDRFVQRTLGFRGYVRYVDDFILLDPNAERLERARSRVEEFLAERLKLAVRAKPIAPVSRGVDFVGYVVRPTYLLPRRRVVRAFEEKVRAMERDLRPVYVGAGARLGLPGLRSVAGPVRALRLQEAANERVRTLWASYEGHLRHAASWRLRERIWRRFSETSRRLRRKAGCATRRFALVRPCASLREQVRMLERGITPEGSRKRAILVVQVGRYAELPHGGFGLRRSRGRRRAFGMCWRFAHRLVERILRRGHPVAVALEEPESCGNVKRRRLAYLFEPPTPKSFSKEKTP